MRLNGFFSIVELNGRKSSERYQNLIPSYNIKGCFFALLFKGSYLYGFVYLSAFIDC